LVDKKKTRAEVLSQMTDIICTRLNKMPVAEKKSRVRDFKEAVSRGGKRSNSRPKAATTARIPRKSQRTQPS
jgi:hypothetical protein